MTDSILIIEGEPTLRRELTSVLNEASFAVADVSDYPEALLKLDEFNPDIAIVDEVLPGGDGRDACFQLHYTFGIPVILMGEDSSDKAWERAIQAGADFYLKKPFSYWQLVARVRAILRRYKKLLEGRGSQMAQAYCFRCKVKREIKNAERVLLKNNRPGLKGVCSVCGGKVFRIGKG